MHDIINNNKYKYNSLLKPMTHVHAEYNVHIKMMLIVHTHIFNIIHFY